MWIRARDARRKSNEFVNTSSNTAGENRRKIYGVSEISRLVKSTLEDEIGLVWIEGEISGLRRPASGHLYFDLKDADSLINAVLFRGNLAGVRTPLDNGLQVRVYGSLTTYAPRSSYQVMVRQVEAVGKGSLQEQFEKLKEQLAKEGLFDPARKRPLPALPQHIGIVTSTTGAAIRDILNILGRRFPNLHVLIAPVMVQGEGAAASIAKALDFLNARGGLDVLIVGRGGGSLEDLWAFNEETVARAIYRSKIPVISAVGHEVDFTISDFVADLRAPTPSAAAELVVRAKTDWEELLASQQRRLVRALQSEWLQLKNRLTRSAGSYVFREPQNLVRQFAQRIEAARTQMAQHLRAALTESQQRVDEAGLKLSHCAQTATLACSARLERLALQLRALNPSAVLERGYSITYHEGRIVRRAQDVKAGTRIETRVSEGAIASVVEKRKG